jgi:hypothetical protein
MVETHQETLLNTDLATDNERQDYKIGAVCGGGVFVRGKVEQRRLR